MLSALILILIWLAFVFFAAFAGSSTADAQDLVVPDVQLPVTGEILALDSGDRAPHAGMLIADEDLVAWRQAIERLTYRLVATVALDAQTCDLRVHEDASRTAAATDRLTLHDELWTQRATDLSTALAESRSRQGPAWYEQPLLWVVVGAILGGAVVGLIAGAVR